MLKAEEYSSKGAPVISVGEIREGYLEIGSKTSRVSDETIARLPRFLLRQNDIVFGGKGSTHGNALIKKGEEGFFLGSDGIRLRVIDESICPKYLSYQLRSARAVSWLKVNSEGTTMPSLNQDILSRFSIRLLPVADQTAIAHILNTLDDKSELNRKTSETLEAMAKALFKSWFVDFDPVRAKAEGRPTGLPAEISDLFPDSFEDSELGEIPSGWKVEQLGDCSLHIESGTRPKGGIDKNLTFGIPSIGAESISPIGQFDFSKTKWVDAAFAQSAGRGWIQNYDVALYKDGGKPGEFRPRTAFYGDGFPFEKAMVNEHVFLLRSSQLGQPYLYYLFNFDRN